MHPYRFLYSENALYFKAALQFDGKNLLFQFALHQCYEKNKNTKIKVY